MRAPAHCQNGVTNHPKREHLHTVKMQYRPQTRAPALSRRGTDPNDGDAARCNGDGKRIAADETATGDYRKISRRRAIRTSPIWRHLAAGGRAHLVGCFALRAAHGRNPKP
jgi:hypothetical protein